MKYIFCFILILLSSGQVFASCNSISSDSDDVVKYFKRAARANDFDDAKYQMSRARRSLDDLSSDANDCGCSSAANEFDDAARKAKMAGYADNLEDYKFYSSKALKYYNNGIDYLNSCH